MTVLRPLYAEVLWAQRPDPEDNDRKAFDNLLARLLAATNLPVAWPFVPCSVLVDAEIPRDVRLRAVACNVLFAPVLRLHGAFWGIVEREGEDGTELAFRPIAPAVRYLGSLVDGSPKVGTIEHDAKPVLTWVAPEGWEAIYRAARRQDLAAEALIARCAIVDGEGSSRRVVRLAAGLPVPLNVPDEPSQDSGQDEPMEWAH